MEQDEERVPPTRSSTAPSSIFRPLSAPVLAGLGSSGAAPSVTQSATQSPSIASAPLLALAMQSAAQSISLIEEDPALLDNTLSTKPGLGFPTYPQTLTDLGEDDLFDPAVVSGYITDLAKGSTFNALAASSSIEEPMAEPDHRADGIYDELDDVGGWAAEVHPASKADVGKRIHQGLDRIAAGKTVVAIERTEARRRESQAKDKVDRATVELVLDPRTRMILFRLLSRGRLRTLDGCVSTGKEANVYYGTASGSSNSFASRASILPKVAQSGDNRIPDAPVAVKVYKTSILSFKDRERYVAGEFRFRRGGYNRSSNRKMVQQWAEKEYRNLMRLQDADVPCPIPMILKPPILVMSFFGRDGWPAPLLKDASLSGSRLERAYFRVCVLMRRMFHVAKLVHGDLSEYNMLFWKGEVVIIDVSQSVEHDHPSALDFLRRDCSNVNDFFEKNGVSVVLGLRELFDYITATGMGISESDCSEDLRSLLDNFASQDDKSRQEDKVFMQSFIPRTLHEVAPSKAEIDAVVQDGPDAAMYGKLTRLSISQCNSTGTRNTPQGVDEAESSQGDLSLEKNNTPRPSELIGMLEDSKMISADGENNLGFPNIEFEEDNFDECNEPIATKLPSIATKSSKSSSERTSPAKLRLLARNTSTEALTEPSDTPSSRDRGLVKQEVTRKRTVAFQENEPQTIVSQKSKAVNRASFPRPRHFAESDGRTSSAMAESKLDGSESSNFDELDESTFEWTHPDSLDDQYDAQAEAQGSVEGLTRKERKKLVKAEARERRENKLPKHVKKRKEALAKRRRGVKVKK